MVTRRARTFFGLCLAFALLPLVSTSAGERDARTHAAMAWMQFQAKSQQSAQSARPGLAQTDADHPPFTPFTPAAPFHLGPSAIAPAPTPVASRAFVAATRDAVHSARAPPALL